MSRGMAGGVPHAALSGIFYYKYEFAQAYPRTVGLLPQEGSEKE
jgi:hypothetical protein